MLTPPPLNDQGHVAPHNHTQILDSDYVIRLISSEWQVLDEKFPEGKRLSSVAWEPSSELNGGVSVVLESLLIADELNIPEFITSSRYPASIKMNVGSIRQHNFQVGYDPVKDEPSISDNPYHCQIWGVTTKGKQNLLKNISSWVVALNNVSLGRNADRIQI